jgi:hypothetical protein
MFQDILQKIQQHPIWSAVILVIVAYFLYTFVTKKTAPASSSVTSTPLGAGSTPLHPSEVYNQTFNSYPIVATKKRSSKGKPIIAQTPIPPIPAPGAYVPPVTKKPIPTPVYTPPIPTKRYVTAGVWPGPNSDLSMIAAANGISLAQIEALNPQLSGNYNLIYPGTIVRVA